MIMLLAGEETFLLRRRLKQLKNAFKEKYDAQNTGIVELSGTALTLNALHEAAAVTGLFAEKRFVVIEGLLSQSKRTTVHKDVEAYVASHKIPEDNIVVFVEPVKPPVKPRGLWKALLAGKHVETFASLNAGALNTWVAQTVADNGGTIEPDALRLLTHACGGNLWSLNNEIHKLLYGSKNKIITARDVRQHVQSPFDENIFHFIDALARRDMKKSLRLLEDQFMAGVEPMALLSHLARQFRLIAHLKSLPENVSDDNAKMQTGAHPYVIKKTRPAVRTFSVRDIKRITEALFESDRKLKTTSVNPKVVFHRFIITACDAS